MSMITTDSRLACLTNERLLEDLVGGLYPHNQPTNTGGFADAVVASYRSKRGVSTLDLSGGAKPADDNCNRWEVKYKVKRCDDACTLSADPCEDIAADVNPWLYSRPVMGDALCSGFSISDAEFRCLCDGKTETVSRNMREVYDSLVRQRNARFLAQFVAGAGNYYTTDPLAIVDSKVNPITIPILTTDLKPQPMGLFLAHQQYRKMGVDLSDVYYVGGSILDAYADASNIYRGNLDGNDAAKGRSNNIFSDYDIDGVYDDTFSHIVSFAAGAVFPLTYNKYKTDDGTPFYASATQTRRTFDLGRAFGNPGFFVDETISVKECGDDVKIIYKYFLNTDLCKIPDDAFSAACNQHHNYCLNWIADCGDLDCNTIKNC